MTRTFATLTFSIGMLAATLACAGPASRPADPPPTAALDGARAPSEEPVESAWPHRIDDGTETILLYQPQIESWIDSRLAGRAAVSIEKQSTPLPAYGVIWFTARTAIDKATRLVTLEDFQITKSRFPTEPDAGKATLAAIGGHLADASHTIALDRLEASLRIRDDRARTATMPLANDPPRIFVSRVPALLVLVDGAPVLRAVPGASLERVINTRALLALDPERGHYFLWLADRWLEGRTLHGPWTEAATPPPALAVLKSSVAESGEVDLQGDASPDVQALLARNELPAIYLSTDPAELLQIRGEPDLAPIDRTALLEIANTSSDLFVDAATSDTYVLLSGRWFRAHSLDGPWSYVKAADLPADFARIPESHPKGRVLASVAGTPQAKEAAIANQIPQTATIRRGAVQFEPRYDGAPQFEPIAGTSLLAAANTPSAVIQVAPARYFGCEDGVWFEAATPTGPWRVADAVPDVIYTIPPRSRLYAVTFVRIYDATPEVVHVGYTPGYYGTYVTPDGCVVYGTGYRYDPWIGSVWFGWPYTYGFGAGYVFGADSGFLLAGALFEPWWGPWGWGWRHHGFHDRHDGDHRDLTAFNRDHDAYRRWGAGAVSSHPGPTHVGSADHHGAGLFTGRDGNVYRPGAAGWERHAQSGWQPLGRQQLETQRSLDRESWARGMGDARWNDFRLRDFGSGASAGRNFAGARGMGGSGSPAFHGGGGVGFHGGGGGGRH